MKKTLLLTLTLLWVLLSPTLTSCRSSKTVSQQHTTTDRIDSLAKEVRSDSTIAQVQTVDSLINRNRRDSTYSHTNNTYTYRNDSTVAVIRVDTAGNILSTQTDRWHNTLTTVHDTLRILVNQSDTTAISSHYQSVLQSYRQQIDSLTLLANHSDQQTIVKQQTTSFTDRLKTWLLDGLIWLVLVFFVYLMWKYASLWLKYLKAS